MSWSVCYESIYLKTRGDVFKLLLLCAGRREKAEKARMLRRAKPDRKIFPSPRTLPWCSDKTGVVLAFLIALS
jgi:hypothetical protein